MHGYQRPLKRAAHKAKPAGMEMRQEEC